MGFTVSQVLEFVQENDVKFIRLAFCNLLGMQKNIAIMTQELPRAFESGICIDTSAAAGFVPGESHDILLFPDPDTLTILPWRPSQGRVVRMGCEMLYADGTPYPGDGRALLHKAASRGLELGYTCDIGCECEFYLFQLDDAGAPTLIPHDQAGYCDMAPLDKGENVRREICLALEDMGITPESSHHERGPGQNEIVCRCAGALTAADQLVSLRTVCEVIAAHNGLSASFLPKPLPHKSGSSLHINLSLAQNGANISRPDGEHSPETESFLAGILHHLREITLFLNPLASSYERIGSDISRALTWSHENRSQLVRIPSAAQAHKRMELRSPDPSCNPYLAFALLLEAGFDGLEQRRPLVRDLPGAKAPELPADLGRAIELAGASELVRRVIPQAALAHYLAMKGEEFTRCKAGE